MRFALTYAVALLFCAAVFFVLLAIAVRLDK